MPPVFLVGFMASGKSSVGTELARQLGRPFVDLDAQIEEAAGTTIPTLFEREGEEGFRAIESAQLDTVIKDSTDTIVATGGGTPCFGDAMDRMRASGLVVHLASSLDATFERVSDPAGRPLLAKSRDELAALHSSRQSTYRRAHATVDSEERSVAELATDLAVGIGQLERFDHATLERASVLALRDRSYPVLVERGSLDRLGALVGSALPNVARVAVVTDKNVEALYGDRAVASLEAAGLTVHRETVEAGETSKSPACFLETLEHLIGAGLDRSSLVVALGGGVVGDLAGYVAASLYRGVAVVQVPTTILAMTDSAIGGKTGINSNQGKNLIGAFWQPALVLADPDVLATLPPRERRAAFGELVKYGLLDSEDLMQGIEAMAPAIGADAPIDDGACDVIRRCAAYKAAIVGADERERGLRALLNLGHTVAHAIEAHAGYGVVLHGEAVALGLIAACRVSAAIGKADPALEQRVVDVLSSAGLDTDLDPWLRPEVLKHIGVDKKRTGTTIRFIAVSQPGQPALVELELGRLESFLLP